MIYTVTLSPSIDYIVRLSNMRFNVTNRTDSEEFYFGGKGLNVSQVLAELDLDSTALGFIAGFTGDAIEKGIKNSRIRTDFIRLSEGFTRINIKIKAGGETEVNGQGPDIPEEALEALMKKLDAIRDGDTLVLAGSIPKTCPDDVYERMLERVKDRDIMIVVDATKQLLVNSLACHPFVIKPNRLELSEILSTLESCRRWARATSSFPSAERAPSCSMRTAKHTPAAFSSSPCSTPSAQAILW